MWSVVLRMQYGRFLPKSALQLQRHHFTLPVAKQGHKHTGHHRRNGVASGGLLVGQRTHLQFDFAAHVVNAMPLRRGIAKVQNRRLGIHIQFVMQPFA